MIHCILHIIVCSCVAAASCVVLLLLLLLLLTQVVKYRCMYLKSYTSDTPKVCQLPAGMAEKDTFVLYHPLHARTKKTK